MAGESPDRSKQRESSAEPTSGSASPVPEARSEAAPKRDPRLAVARDTERSAKRGGADTATRVLSTRTAEKPGEEADAERDAGEAGSPADAERGEGEAGSTADAEREADAEQGSDEADSATDAEQDADDTRAEGPAAEAEQGDSDAGTGTAAAEAERDAGETDSAADTEQNADDTDSAADTEQDADDTDSASDAEQGGTDAGAKGAAAGASQGSAEEDVKGSGESSGSGQRGDDTASGDGRLRDAVAAWVASADQDEEPAAAEGRGERAEGAGKGSEDGQEAAERAEEAAEADTDGQKPEKAAEADVDARDDQDAEGGEEAATDVEDRPRTEGADNAATDGEDRPKAGDSDEADEAGAGAEDGQEEADEPEADRSATGASEDASADTTTSDDTDDTPEKPETAEADGADKAPESDDTDTGKGDAEPPVDQPTAVFKAVRPPVDQPTTMLKLGGAAKEAKDAKDAKDAKAAPEKDAERTSKFVALKPLDDPAARKPATAPAPADATASVPTVGPERTTQQPLPPRPPLDLLAELTNTPPPPDTPLRTAVRRVKIWTPLVLLLVIVFGVVQSVRPLPAPTLELTAEDSYTFEGGKVDIPWPAKGQAALDVQGIGTFGSSGEQKPVPIASVAKVMTAYVILRDHPLKSGADGPKIDIDQAAEDQSDAGQESTVDVTKGDKISQREALESILIASANNVARLLARWDAGSEKAFVGKMNDAAKDLGMKNTTYTDPSGLNNTTVSTAVDQVKLAKAAMEQPAFREVAAMMSYVDYKGTKHDNWNRLVGYNDVTGIKTGTTTSALGNLVFSARKEVNGETRRIVGAVVRQPAGGPDNTILGAALHEGDKLIKAAQGALESATILKKGTVVGYADDGLGGRTPVAVTEDVTAVGWAGLSVKLTFAADELPHTAKAGKKVGTLTVGDGSTNAVKVPVALQKDLVEPGFADKLTRIG
ncbi:D-alanyl-D-alanine carboxypeptidase [Streptomyces coeruleorubidus]|uniref:serine-type D-Ala-D-Ala carboxypeptidase n=1 Tax=Streptomyces coeruleorubidus TaxID=116188 RepID=A0A5J6I1X8_STRC4|nr:D-alanyl-D-alanine carboxypeptidase [Streptomyces coeruleorubidus]QEV26028.1 D-alanyl-D-alanine carboxypeptidase [Streptomyces coeruleorubidus]